MTLKIRYVTKIEHRLETGLWGGREKSVVAPVGDIHIFEMVKVTSEDGKRVTEEISAYSLCARSRSEIGTETKDTDKRPAGLGMCPACEAAWKRHPSSPWRAWAALNIPTEAE